MALLSDVPEINNYYRFRPWLAEDLKPAWRAPEAPRPAEPQGTDRPRTPLDLLLRPILGRLELLNHEIYQCQ